MAGVLQVWKKRQGFMFYRCAWAFVICFVMNMFLWQYGLLVKNLAG